MTFRFPEEYLATAFAEAVRPDCAAVKVDPKRQERSWAKIINSQNAKFPHVSDFPWRDDDDWAADGNDWGGSSGYLRVPDCEVTLDAPDDVLAAAAWLAGSLTDHMAFAARAAAEAVNDEVVSDCDCGAWYTYREWGTLRLAYCPGEDWEARRCASCDATVLAYRWDMRKLFDIWLKGNPECCEI